MISYGSRKAGPDQLPAEGFADIRRTGFSEVGRLATTIPLIAVYSDQSISIAPCSRYATDQVGHGWH